MHTRETTEGLPAYLRTRLAADAKYDAPVRARTIPVPPPRRRRAILPPRSPPPGLAPELGRSLPRRPRRRCPRSPTDVPFGVRFVALLAWAGVSAERLAQETGIGRSNVYGYRRADANPGPATRAKLAAGLGVDVALLGAYVERRGGPRPRPTPAARTVEDPRLPFPRPPPRNPSRPRRLRRPW
jgi:transcriptional regulator with XRE-family HTH domain